MRDSDRVHDSRNVASIKLLLRRQIKDPDGRIVFDSGDQPSHSFVLQFLDILAASMDHAEAGVGAAENVTDVTNTARSIQANGSCTGIEVLCLAAPAGTSTYGTVVGTGGGAESNASYTLTTQVAHGAGAGQLNYGACAITHAAIVGTNVDMVVTRSWTNGSGGTITINEIGIYMSTTDSGGSTYRYFCIVRDLLSVVDDINNGQTYTVTYTLRTTV